MRGGKIGTLLEKKHLGYLIMRDRLKQTVDAHRMMKEF